MARQVMTPQAPTPAGITPTYAAAHVDGHSFRNSGRSILHVKNGGAGSTNVTIQTPGTADGLAVTDRVVAIPAGQERMISLPQFLIYQQGDGTTWVDISVLTSVTLAVFEGGGA